MSEHDLDRSDHKKHQIIMFWIAALVLSNFDSMDKARVERAFPFFLYFLEKEGLINLEFYPRFNEYPDLYQFFCQQIAYGFMVPLGTYGQRLNWVYPDKHFPKMLDSEEYLTQQEKKSVKKAARLAVDVYRDDREFSTELAEQYYNLAPFG